VAKSNKKSTRQNKKTRKKNSASRLKKESNPSRSLFAETIAVLFLAMAAFVFLSLLSHEFARSGIFYSPSVLDHDAFRNIMGPVGHISATILSGFFGVCALVLVFWLLWLSYSFWYRHEGVVNTGSDMGLGGKLLTTIGAGLGLFGMLIASCAFGAALGGSRIGGQLGALIADPLLVLFHTIGAVLITGAALLLSLALATGRSTGVLIRECIGKLIRLTTHVVSFTISLSITIIRLGGQACVAVYDYWSNYRTIRREQKEQRLLDEEEAAGQALKKRRQKSRKSRQREVFRELADTEDYDEDQEDEVEDEGSETKEILVRRRAESAKPKSTKQLKVKRNAAFNLKEVSRQIPGYELPGVDLLTKGQASVGNEDDEELRAKSLQIERKLRDFNIQGSVTEVHPGPVITLFEFEPAPGVKVGRIAALQDDLAMSLRASSIRIIAPIPKRGTVGIEVPNRQRDIVRLRDLLESEAFLSAGSSLAIPIGKDTYGDPVVADIATMPHLLMAGATGTGKSVCINAVLISLLYRATPEELGLILIDPKILELSAYDGIPHLRVPVVTVPQQAKAVLQWAAKEMDRRYRMMQKFGVRNIDSYNRVVAGEAEYEDSSDSSAQIIELHEEIIVEPGIVENVDEASELGAEDQGDFKEQLEPLQKIVIVIDELADLMLTVGRDIEQLITRLAQKARAAGIHLIIATQRPSVDVITGLIKANFPARLSFRVSSRIDSRTILDSMGAERLLGRGDMLFARPGSGELRRVHGAYVADSEVKRVVDAVKAQGEPQYDERIMAICAQAVEDDSSSSGDSTQGAEQYDAMYDKAVQLVIDKGQASTSMIQRVFRIGYNRAARIIETMEEEGVVGPMDGAKPREVLVPDHDRN